jgi:hypothetical protein
MTRTRTRPVGSAESVDPTVKVSITMRFLAGGKVLDLGWPYGIADSTLYTIIDETLAAMDATLDNIKFLLTEVNCKSDAAFRLCHV